MDAATALVAGSEDGGMDRLSVADAVWLSRHMGERSVPAAANPVSARPPADSGYIGTKAVDRERPQADPVHDEKGKRSGEDQEDEAPLTPPTTGPAPAPGRGPAAMARTGALRTLAGADAIGRAMRAFRTRAREDAGELDEVGTIDDIVEHGGMFVAPRRQPGSRRWLSLSLLVEASASNAMWQQPVEELEAIARRNGVFRMVRRFAMVGEPDTRLLPVGRSGAYGRTAMQLCTSTWRRHEIVLIVSDFTSGPWWDGTQGASLQRIAQRQPLALLHTLPQRLWMRSWIGKPDAVAGAATLACPSAALHARAAGTFRPGQARGGLALPVLGLDAGSFAHWARAMMSHGALTMPAIFLAPRLAGTDADTDAGAIEQAGASELVMAYNMASSPLARQLAKYFAIAAPLTFPVMRWVQQAVMPQSDASHLAEFVLGGLLEQVGGEEDCAADDVVYDFVPGTRELMQVGMPIAHALEVLRTVGAFLEANQRNVLDQRTGIAIWPGQDLSTLQPSLRAFALVSRAFLARVGLASAPGAPGQSADLHLRREVSRLSILAERQSPPKEDADNALHARKFDHSIIDVQWSPKQDGVLAVLHEGGVEVWNTRLDSHGVLVERKGESIPPAPCTVYWFAGRDWATHYNRMASLRAAVRTVTDGLRMAGRSSLHIVQLASMDAMVGAFARAPDDAVLLVFESAPRGEGSSFLLADMVAYALKRNVTVGAVRLMHGAAQASGAHAACDLSDMIGVSSGRVARKHYRHILGAFAAELHNALMRRSGRSGGYIGATAICWLDDGSLAIAERQPEGCQINALDVDSILHSTAGPLAPERILYMSGSGFVHKMCAVSATSGDARSLALAWIDEHGGLRIGGAVRAAGNNLPRLLVRADGDLAAAFSHHGLGMTVISDSPSGGRKMVNLLAQPRLAFENDPLADFALERVVGANIGSGELRVVSSSGYLHRGTLEQANDVSEYPSFSPFDRHPLNLKGKVRAVAFSGDQRTLCVRKASGALELWDAMAGHRTDRLALRARRTERTEPVLSMTRDGGLLAVSEGRFLNVFEVLARRGGAVFGSTQVAQRAHVLWVDDHPLNNVTERDRLKQDGFAFSVAESTKAALSLLRRYRYSAVVSDMGRREGPGEGYVLLSALRDSGDSTPLFFYSTSNSKEHKAQARLKGAQGATNSFIELRDMLMQLLDKTEGGASRSQADSADRLEMLMNQYENIRATQTASDARTEEMTKVVRQIIDLSPYCGNFDYAQALMASRRGLRLAAYALLSHQARPELLDPLVISLVKMEDKPFGQFWALKAVETIVRDYPADSPLPAMAVQQLRQFARKIEHGTDRDYQLRKILEMMRMKAWL